jgi:transcriptional regulator with XRE-family HTH domain
MRQKNIPALNEFLKTLNADIGKCIRRQRHLKGWSQTELGAYLGVSYQQIQKYEQGLNQIDACVLYVLANTFGVPVGWFFEKTGQGAEPDLPLPPLSSGCREEADELIRYYSLLSPRFRQRFFALIRTAAQEIISAAV